MANVLEHAVVGALCGIAPDAVLTLFGWRKDWLPEAHPLVRVHRFIHSWRGLALVAVLAWCSHIVIDKITHRRIP